MEYFKLLQAVENYYGVGSDQWIALASGAATAAERARILKQVPGVYTTVSESGKLLGWSLDASASTMSASEAAAAASAQAINSNAATVAVKELAIPGNAVINETTGVVELSSGATATAGAAAGSKVATVLGHVGTGIVGAAVGMKLGVWIDGALYNANPDFWDSHNMEYLNPERWKETKVTNWLYDYSGFDDFMCLVDDQGQMYIDEQTLALVAQYLASQGAFSYEKYCTNDDLPVSYFNYPAYINEHYTYYTNDFDYYWGNQHIEWNFSNHSDPVYSFVASPNSDGSVEYYIYQISQSPFDGGGPVSGTYTNTYGDTFYYKKGSWVWPDGVLRNVNFNHAARELSYNDSFWLNDISILLFHGKNVEESGVDGINPYAPTPQGIMSDMTPEQIINLLKQQYPEIWNPTDPTQPVPIKNGALQDDGTVTDTVYIPVPVPDGGTDTQPETTPDTPTKPDPSNPTSTENIVKTTNPAPDPTEPEDDKGSGNTPAYPAPTGSADALYKIYNPTNQQIKDFGAWLWSSSFVDQILKLFNDPMQAIISLHKIYATPHTGGTANIKVGYLDSNIPSKWVDEQYIDIDCGTVNVLEVSGNVIDYMSDIRIYLPFIGIVPLSVDDVMRGVVGVKYRVDVITGTLAAFVSITRDSGAGGVIYQYTGSIAEVYPLSSGSYMGIVTGVLGIAAGIAGTIATGGAAAPALIGGAAGLSALHTKVEHSNGFAGNAGALAAKKPYLIISRPQSAMSNGIGANTGWPANYFVKLSQCKGFTKVKSIHLSGIEGADDKELAEIEALLKEGVII